MGVKERVDRIANNRNFSMATEPTMAKIEVSGFCPLNCKFCYQKEMKQEKDRRAGALMSLMDFMSAYDYVKTFPSIKEIGLFYMGESGAHPDLPEFYKQVKSGGYFTFLTTNGVFSSNILRAIPYIDSLKVSWNYTGLTDFLEKTGTNAHYYYAIKENIKLFYDECHRHGKQLAISTVLDHQGREAYESALKQLPYDEHYWIPLQNQGGTQEAGREGVLGEDDHKVSPVPCWSLFRGIYVDSQLNIRVCCYGHSKEHILGNIKNIKRSDCIMGIAQTLKEDNPYEELRQKYREMHLNHCPPKFCNECLRKENG